jgi:hypothetical protein
MQATAPTLKRRGASIFIGKQEYVGFLVGALPTRFAFIFNEDKEQDGITSWFNHKGRTFISKNDLKN